LPNSPKIPSFMADFEIHEIISPMTSKLNKIYADRN